ncbi:MAG: hypothetical protein R3337_09780, partial [Gammaproteobacteria bacterium]|nr:hypothetical protein [Gammaproteobacteria bacterium]
MASLIDIALEGSDNPILATAARAKRLGRIQEEQGRDLVSPLLTRAAGTPESLLSIVSALGSAVPAGLAGAGRLATGGSVDEAVETIQRVQEPLVFRPRTEAGKATLAQDVGILSALAEPSLFIGGQALEETGSPAAATAAELLLDPLNFLGPIGKGAIVAGAIKSGVKPDVSSFLRPDD